MKKRFTKAPEGYYKRNLGFTAPCDVCKVSTRAVSFTYKTMDGTGRGPGGEDLSFYQASFDTLCSFDCFKKTANYIGPNPPLNPAGH